MGKPAHGPFDFWGGVPKPPKPKGSNFTNQQVDLYQKPPVRNRHGYTNSELSWQGQEQCAVHGIELCLRRSASTYIHGRFGGFALILVERDTEREKERKADKGSDARKRQPRRGSLPSAQQRSQCSDSPPVAPDLRGRKRVTYRLRYPI